MRKQWGVKFLFLVSLLSIVVAENIIPISRYPHNYCEFEQTCAKSVQKNLAKYFGKGFEFKTLKNVLSYSQPLVTFKEKDSGKENVYFDLDLYSSIIVANKAHFSAEFLADGKGPLKKTVVLGGSFETPITITKLNDGQDTLTAGSIGMQFQKKIQKGKSNFLQKLKSDKVISSAKFALFLNRDEEHAAANDLPRSQLQLGDLNLKLLEEGHRFKTINFKDGLLSLEALEFNNQYLVINSTNTSVAVNLMSSSIGVPKVVYDQILKQLDTTDLTCGNVANRTVCVNDADVEETLKGDSLPSLSLVFEKQTFTIEGENLFSKCEKIKYGKGKDLAACELRIEVRDRFELGAPFFYEYYTEFNMENSVLTSGKARTQKSKAKAPAKEEDTNKADSVVEGTGFGWEIKLVIVVFFLSFFVGLYLYKKHGISLYTSVTSASAQKPTSIDSSDIHADYGPSINYRDPKIRAEAANEYDNNL